MGKQKTIKIIAKSLFFVFILTAMAQHSVALSRIYVQPQICNKEISVIDHNINSSLGEYIHIRVADKKETQHTDNQNCWYFHQNLLLSQPSKFISLDNIEAYIDKPNIFMDKFVHEGTYNGSYYYWIWRQFNILGIGQYMFSDKPMGALDIIIQIPSALGQNSPSFNGYDYIVHFYHYAQREPITIFAKPQDFKLLPKPQIFQYPLFKMGIIE